MIEGTATLLEVTDIDGDKLTVEVYGPGQWVLSVSGEDGHRSVILGEGDMANLASLVRKVL